MVPLFARAGKLQCAADVIRPITYASRDQAATSPSRSEYFDREASGPGGDGAVWHSNHGRASTEEPCEGLDFLPLVA